MRVDSEAAHRRVALLARGTGFWRSLITAALLLTPIVHGQTVSGWQVRNSGTTANLHSVVTSQVGSGVVAIAVGDQGTIVVSMDRGTTWSSAVSGTTATLHAVTYEGISRRFIAVGERGTIVSSADGLTWTPESSPTNLTLYAVSGTLAVGQAGVGLLVRGSDGVWTQRAVPFAGVTMYAIRGATVVAGQGGASYTSSDGGMTWQSQDSGTGSDLYAIDSDWSSTLFGANGAGVSGTSETIRGACKQFGGWFVIVTMTVHPTLGEEFAVGSNGIILRRAVAEGAGASSFTALATSWVVDVSPTRSNLNAVVPLPDSSGRNATLVVGDGGTILVHPVTPPVITSAPVIRYDASGTPYVEATAVGDGAWSYGWFTTTGGALFPIGTGYPRQSLGRDNPYAFLNPGALYRLVAINAYGTAYADTPGNRLINLSSRASVGTGDNVLISGFATNGGKTLLVRAAGPSLAQFGVAHPLPAPRLTVYSGGTVLATNTGWQPGSAINDATSKTGAFPFPAGSSDCALVINPPAGLYTVVVDSADVRTGVALVEIYDADPVVSGVRLTNLSTRANVSSGEQVLIGGLTVQGGLQRNYLIRAVGPTLGTFGVQGALSAPRLTLYRGNVAIATAGPWNLQANATQIRDGTAALKAFALPDGSSDAALLLPLDGGTYTIQVSGDAGASGVALIEVYEVP